MWCTYSYETLDVVHVFIRSLRCGALIVLLCRLSRDKALDVVHLFIQGEADAARRFEAHYPGADREVLQSVLAGLNSYSCVCLCGCEYFWRSWFTRREKVLIVLIVQND